MSRRTTVRSLLDGREGTSGFRCQGPRCRVALTGYLFRLPFSGESKGSSVWDRTRSSRSFSSSHTRDRKRKDRELVLVCVSSSSWGSTTYLPTYLPPHPVISFITVSRTPGVFRGRTPSRTDSVPVEGMDQIYVDLNVETKESVYKT